MILHIHVRSNISPYRARETISNACQYPAAPRAGSKVLAHLDFAQFCDKVIEKLSEIKNTVCVNFFTQGNFRAAALIGGRLIILG